jgi:hypothetical protein
MAEIAGKIADRPATATAGDAAWQARRRREAARRDMVLAAVEEWWRRQTHICPITHNAKRQTRTYPSLPALISLSPPPLPAPSRHPPLAPAPRHPAPAPPPPLPTPRQVDTAMPHSIPPLALAQPYPLHLPAVVSPTLPRPDGCGCILRAGMKRAHGWPSRQTPRCVADQIKSSPRRIAAPQGHRPAPRWPAPPAHAPSSSPPPHTPSLQPRPHPPARHHGRPAERGGGSEQDVPSSAKIGTGSAPPHPWRSIPAASNPLHLSPPQPHCTGPPAQR